MERVIRAKVTKHELPEHKHRWFGVVELDNGLYLYMSGIVAWLFEGGLEVVLKNQRKRSTAEMFCYLRTTNSTKYMRERESKSGMFSIST